MADRVIPVICAKYPLAHFIIGGDGPKKLLIEEMKERNLLHDRVELLGEVPHGRVRDVRPYTCTAFNIHNYLHIFNMQHNNIYIQHKHTTYYTKN